MSDSHLVVGRELLGPVLVLVGLAYLTAAAILVTRLADMLRGGRSAAFYEDYSGGGPLSVRRATSQLANVFEFPVLFLVAACLATACGIDDRWLVGSAWVFVVLRWAHAIIRLTSRFNRLWLRTPIFMLSNLILLVMWIELARRVVYA